MLETDILTYLQADPDHQAVLAVFAELHLATTHQLMRATRLPRHRVETVLNGLMAFHAATPEPAITHCVVRRGLRFKYLAEGTTPHVVYELGAWGARALRTLKLSESAKPNGLSDKVSVGHRLCLLDVVQACRQAGQTVWSERVFEQPCTTGGKQQVRVDVAVHLPDGRWRMVEVEQDAPLTTHNRRVEKLVNLARFFSTQPADFCPEVVMVFNVKEAAYPAAVHAWRLALASLPTPSAPVAYRIYPQPWHAWHSQGWEAALENPALEPLSSQELADMELASQAYEKGRKDNKRDLERERFLRAVVTRNQLGALHVQPAPPANLAGLLATAWDIYAPSRGQNALSPAEYYSFPSASLRAYRAWLSERRELWELLRVQLGRIKPWTVGQTLTTLYDRTMWTTLLRHFGVAPPEADGFGGLQVFTRANRLERDEATNGVGYGGLYVAVSLSAGLWWQVEMDVEDLITVPFPVSAPDSTTLDDVARMMSREKRLWAEKAVSWFLTAPSTYGLELGLDFNELLGSSLLP